MTDYMLGREVQMSEVGELTPILLDKRVRVTFRSLEVQALCPAVAGVQPDIYDCTLEFEANVSIESKSLKLWLTTFRDQRIFAEHLAIVLGDTIAEFGVTNDADMRDVTVTLVQNIRGGIVETVTYQPGASR